MPLKKKKEVKQWPRKPSGKVMPAQGYAAHGSRCLFVSQLRGQALLGEVAAAQLAEYSSVARTSEV